MGPRSALAQCRRSRRGGGPARPEEARRDTYLYADLHQQPEREVHAHDCRFASEARERPKDYQCEARATGTVRDRVAAERRTDRVSLREACRQEVPGAARPEASGRRATEF